VSKNPPKRLITAIKTITDFFNRDNDLTDQEKENFKDTPLRVAKAWCETTRTTTEIKEHLDSLFKTSFPVNDDQAGMVTQGPISINSYCPHHLLPVFYEAYVSYIPKEGGRVVGLSKIARAAEELGKRPILQEQLAKDIADVFYHSEAFPFLETAGSAISLVGRHSCMTCRGVKSLALTGVTELRGSFWEGSNELKFYQAISNIRESKV